MAPFSLCFSLVGIVMVLSLYALIDADRRAYKRPRLLFALHFEIESFYGISIDQSYAILMNDFVI